MAPRSNLTRSFLAFILVASVSCPQARADEQPSSFERARTPGAGHATLASLAGSYTLTATFWAEPAAAPQVSELPARRELILGGRALRLEVGPSARGFLGTGLMGFDNVDDSFWYVWTDTSTTGVSSLDGRLGKRGEGILEGQTPTPSGATPLRVEIRFDGAIEIHDHYVSDGGGGEHRMLELRYQRAAL